MRYALGCLMPWSNSHEWRWRCSCRLTPLLCQRRRVFPFTFRPLLVWLALLLGRWEPFRPPVETGACIVPPPEPALPQIASNASSCATVASHGASPQASLHAAVDRLQHSCRWPSGPTACADRDSSRDEAVGAISSGGVHVGDGNAIEWCTVRASGRLMCGDSDRPCGHSSSPKR